MASNIPYPSISFHHVRKLNDLVRANLDGGLISVQFYSNSPIPSSNQICGVLFFWLHGSVCKILFIYLSLCFLRFRLSCLYWVFFFFWGQFLKIKWAHAWTCVCGGSQIFNIIFVKFLLNFVGLWFVVVWAHSVFLGWVWFVMSFGLGFGTRVKILKEGAPRF